MGSGQVKGCMKCLCDGSQRGAIWVVQDMGRLGVRTGCKTGVEVG